MGFVTAQSLRTPPWSTSVPQLTSADIFVHNI